MVTPERDAPLGMALEELFERIDREYDSEGKEALDEAVDKFLGREVEELKKNEKKSSSRKKAQKEGYRGSGLTFGQVYGFSHSAQGWAEGSGSDFLKKISKIPRLEEDDLAILLRSIEAGVFARERLRTNRGPNAGDSVEADQFELEELGNLGKRAFDKVFESNLKLVVHVANRWRSFGLEIDDLIQSGSFGLIRAIEGFDYKKGFKFSTYAFRWIEQTIRRALSDSSRIIRIPAHAYSGISDFERWMAYFDSDAKTAPTRAQQLDRISQDFDSHHEAIRASAIPVQSLDGPTNSCEVGAESPSLSAQIIDYYQEDLEESLARQMEGEKLINLMSDFLEPRSRLVLAMRFGLLGKDHTLDEIGNQIGLTRERARQIQVKALGQLHEILAAEE
jgi:RNA polymerase primary sigma factor